MDAAIDQNAKNFGHELLQASEIMGNSRIQSQSVNDANRKALRQAVKHRAKVRLVRGHGKPLRAFPRRQG